MREKKEREVGIDKKKGAAKIGKYHKREKEEKDAKRKQTKVKKIEDNSIASFLPPYQPEPLPALLSCFSMALLLSWAWSPSM